MVLPLDSLWNQTSPSRPYRAALTQPARTKKKDDVRKLSSERRPSLILWTSELLVVDEVVAHDSLIAVRAHANGGDPGA